GVKIASRSIAEQWPCQSLDVNPSTIVLVKTLSRSHAHRFSEAVCVLRARRRVLSHIHGRTAMWRAKRCCWNWPSRTNCDIAGNSKSYSSEIDLTATNGS